MNRFIYSDEMLEWVKDNQADITRTELTKRFNEKFGTDIKRNGLLSLCGRRGWRSSKNTGQIKKGCTAWNKGVTGYMGANKTSFKSGESHFKHKSIGSERYRMKSGKKTVMIKVSEPNEWRAKHLEVWESVHGKLPRHHCIKFLDNDHTNNNINNLVCVNRAVNAALRFNPTNSDNPDINHAIILTEKLRHTVKNIDKLRSEL